MRAEGGAESLKAPQLRPRDIPDGWTRPGRTYLLLLGMVAVILLMLSLTMTIGADAMWLVALGDYIRRTGQIPEGVPFAAADSASWVNVPVLGELSFSWLNSLGPLGLPLPQLVIVAVLIGLVVVACRRHGAADGPIALVIALTALGTMPALGVLRAQMLSLVPFVALGLLLRTEHQRPTKKVWLVVPLIAIWGNLHGAVLLGVALAGAYLLLSRLSEEPLTALGVGAATISALFLTPGLLSTPKYYVDVLSNEALDRGSELWAAPSPDKPFDVLMVTAAVALLALVLLRPRLVPLWEWAVLAGLSYMMISSARHGVWLILFLAVPAARGTTLFFRRREEGAPAPLGRALTATLVLACLVGAFALGSRQSAFRQSSEVVSQITQLARGDRVVLAPEPLVEALAAEGVRVWMGNPIDAFSRSDQAAYLDFLSGKGQHAGRAFAQADVVVVKTGSAPAALAFQEGFRVHSEVGGYALMLQYANTSDRPG